jgi:putative transposase
VKGERPSKPILFGEGSLRRALREFEAHYHGERNHQVKGNILLLPCDEAPTTKRGPSIRCHERLGGLLKYYHRKAA